MRTWMALRTFFTTLLCERSGQDFIEYALLVALATVFALTCFPEMTLTVFHINDVMHAVINLLNAVGGGAS